MASCSRDLRRCGECGEGSMQVMDMSEEELGSAGAWHAICNGKPSEAVGDTLSIGVGAVDTEGAVMRQSWPEVIPEDAVWSP